MAHILAYETSVEIQHSHSAQAISEVQHALSRGLENFRGFSGLGTRRGIPRRITTKGPSSASSRPWRWLRATLSPAAAWRRIRRDGADRRVRQGRSAAWSDDPGNIAPTRLSGGRAVQKQSMNRTKPGGLPVAMRSYEQGLRLRPRQKRLRKPVCMWKCSFTWSRSTGGWICSWTGQRRMRTAMLISTSSGGCSNPPGRPIPEWQASIREGAATYSQPVLSRTPDDAVAQAYLGSRLVHASGRSKMRGRPWPRAGRRSRGRLMCSNLTSRMYALRRQEAGP